MSSEAIVRTVSLSVVIVVMLVVSFLFYQVGEANLATILLFVSIFFGLMLASGVVIHDKKKR